MIHVSEFTFPETKTSLSSMIVPYFTVLNNFESYNHWKKYSPLFYFYMWVLQNAYHTPYMLTFC